MTEFSTLSKEPLMKSIHLLMKSPMILKKTKFSSKEELKLDFIIIEKSVLHVLTNFYVKLTIVQ
jgi:hypothetical protein